MDPTPEQVAAGHAFYTRRSLAVYDLAILGYFSRLAWRLANPGATVFGATLLHDGVPRNWFARQVMARNNAHGIFSNAADTLEGLRAAVSDRLSGSSIEVVGCVGLFAGTVA